MPNRILKESICTSDSINKLSWFEEVLFYRLMVNCDDFGRYDARPAVIKGKLFPLKGNVTIKTVTDAINKLASAELVTLYQHEGKPYLYLPTWNDHQTIRAKKSKFPDPSESTCIHMNANEINCNQMQADDSVIHSYSYSNSYSESESGKRFTPPTKEEIQAYCDEKGYNIDVDFFFNYYNSSGWRRKDGTKVLNWKQTVITWAKKDEEKPPRKNKVITAANYKPPQAIDTSLLDKIKGAIPIEQ